MKLKDDEVTTHTGGLTTHVPSPGLRKVKTESAPGVNTKSGHKHQKEFEVMTNDRPAWHLRWSKAAMVCPVPTHHSPELRTADQTLQRFL